MSNTHEALYHADLLSKEVWPADMTIARWADKSADTIRTQHALIVEGLRVQKAALPYLLGRQYNQCKAAIDAATQYLKGQQ